MKSQLLALLRHNTLIPALAVLLVGCAPATDPVAAPESNVETGAAFSFECPVLDGVNPLPDVRATIEANEKSFLKSALDGDMSTLDTLLADAMSYVHENGQVSTKQEFFDDYLSQGYQEAVAVPKEIMRQFCSTVFTVSTGHLRLNGEGEYPPTSVTHVWAKQGDRWVLVHRHESHKGGPLGKQLPQEGAPNNTGKVGAEPDPATAELIADNQAAWIKAMIETDPEVMDRLMNESLHYVHVTDHTSTKTDFMKELMGGFTETDFHTTTMRQFGNTVIVLFNAHYRHLNEPDQSRSQAMHAWVKNGDDWQIVARHSARFEPY